jgi:hypothetical protein
MTKLAEGISLRLESITHMKRYFLALSAITLITASAWSTEPKDEVKAATKKLGQAANYSWSAKPKSEGDSSAAGAGPMEGSTEKDGYTFVTLSVGNTDVELAFKGEKAAIKQEEEWKGTDELDGSNAWIAKRLKAFKVPAVEAEDLADKVSEFKKGDNSVISGELSDAGLKELFSRTRRREGGNPLESAKGWAKFWTKDGLLTKYQYNVQGTVKAGADKHDVEFNRTTTVEIKDVGTTTVKIPADAKKKLS